MPNAPKALPWMAGRMSHPGRAPGRFACLVLAGCLVGGCQTLPPPAMESPTATVHTPVPATDPGATIRHPPAPDVELIPEPGIRIEPAQLPGSDDLLAGIASRFIIEAALNPAIEREQSWFLSHPEYLNRVFERARPYLYFVVEEIESRNMPLELALLPVIESAFDPFAYSHGRAAGLWQIIPGTARRLGVKQNWWFDGRRDIVQSTRGALSYLQTLHRQFDGDWLLAIAAYNTGEGNVARAIKRNAQAGEATDFWHLNLRRETRNYVPRFLALLRIIRDAASHDLKLPAIADEPYFVRVDVHGQIDLALAAELAAMSIDELYLLNPGFNRWATDPEGPHRLLVPIELGDAFRGKLLEVPAEARVQWTRYKIKPGDTLSQIAQRFNTTPAVIRQSNELGSSLIRAGHYLMIPEAAQSMSAYRLSADSRLASKVDTRHGQSKQVHTVKPGESVWSIAQAYGVNHRALARWNGMAVRDTLSIGHELVVWDGRPLPRRASPTNPIRRLSYVVKRGDSLAKISSRFSVKVTDLLRWNALSADQYLQPGQRLVVFVDVTQQTG